MSHVQIPRTLATILVAASCAGVSATAAAPGKDNPAIERTQGSCSKVLTRTEVEMLPTEARDFADLAKIAHGPISPATVDFTFNTRGRLTGFMIDGEGLSVKTGIQRVDPDTCEVLTKRTKAEFGNSGISGSVQFLFRPDPEPSLQGTFTNLRGGRERFSPTFKLEWRGVRNFEPRIPSDPGTPGVPVPAPGAPDVPVPAPTQPLFMIPNWGSVFEGLTGRYRVSVLAHDYHDLHSVMVNVVKRFICTEGEGEGAAKVDKVNTDNIQVSKTIQPRGGWKWNPIVFSNAPDGIRGEATGTFYGKPVVAAFWGLEAAPGSPNFRLNLSVTLVETQSAVPFLLEGRVEQSLKY